jgi:hypothetical protein
MENLLKPKLKLVKGTRFVSFLFIGCSILIAAGILFAANMYYNIDTGEIVMEEIQRTTGLIRAVGGAIIGGTSTSTLSAGVAFQVATTSDVLLSGADQVLRFSGGDSSYYTGFKATTTLTTTTVYVWPGAYPATTSYYLTANPITGEMAWGVPSGAGDIQAVGDVGNGLAFTSDLGTTYGTTLWFHPNATYTGALTIDSSLGANATYTLPAISGTNYLTLTSGNLGSGGVLFANSGLIATSTYFTWSTSSRALSLGSDGNTGQLRIYSGNSTNYLGFMATSTMTGNTEYYWPEDYGTTDFVLTTDGLGQLIWKSVEGVGGITGSGQDGRVTFWTGANTLGSSASFTWSTSTNVLTLDGGLGSLAASLIQASTTLTLQALSGNILLDPSTYIVELATSTYIQTHGGYEIGRAGTQILREMIPILGFDLPVQTATTTYVQVSRTIEDYPFSAAATGTTRVFKLVFRYAASTSNAINVQVATTSGAYPSFQLPIPGTANLDKGQAYLATTTIPIDSTDWWIELQTVAVPDVVRIFQIFLAAYDQID